MIIHYNTDLTTETCGCGESCLLSSMLKIKLPCSHLRYIGIDFPHIEPPDISFDNAPKCELIFEYDIIDSQFVEAEKAEKCSPYLHPSFFIKVITCLLAVVTLVYMIVLDKFLYEYV